MIGALQRFNINKRIPFPMTAHPRPIKQAYFHTRIRCRVTRDIKAGAPHEHVRARTPFE